MEKTREIDPEIADLIQAEAQRQAICINLIAAGNFALGAILEAEGSITTNILAEGYPGNRIHGGTKYLDAIETLAIERAKTLFRAEHANVQPHSGSSANLAVFFAVLNLRDKVLSMVPSYGGHHTHGSPTNISGRWFEPIYYHASPRDERIDYDEVHDLAKKHRPRLIIAGSSTYPRIIDFAIFREIASEVGAYLLVDMAQIAGLVAAGFHPSPVPYVDFVTSSLCKTLRGGKGGFILCKKEFSNDINKAVVPGVQATVISALIAAKAICFEYATSDKFKKYIEQVCLNSKVLASSLQKLGYRIVSGGTDNHIVLVDLQNKGITGMGGQDLLEEVTIVVNRSMVPFNRKGLPTTDGIRRGIRLGSAPMTARGFGKEEFEIVARLVDRALDRGLSLEGKEAIKKEVSYLCHKYPVDRNCFY